jgi:hypothetical protein
MALKAIEMRKIAVFGGVCTRTSPLPPLSPYTLPLSLSPATKAMVCHHHWQRHLIIIIIIVIIIVIIIITDRSNNNNNNKDRQSIPSSSSS